MSTAQKKSGQRVLQIAHGHPSFHPGGTELTALALHRQALESGHDSWYLGALNDARLMAGQGTSMVALTQDQREAALFSGSFRWFALAQYDHFHFLREFRDYLVIIRPDIVHVHHVIHFGLEALHLIRNTLPEARIVLTLHDYYLICANNGQLYKHELKERCAGPDLHQCLKCLSERSANDLAMRSLDIRNAISLCDRLVSPSEFLKDKFDRYLGAAQPIAVIENGYLGESLEPAGSNVDGDGPFTFGYFGNIAAVKGLGDLLDACAILAADEWLDFRLNVHGGQLIDDAALLAKMERAGEALGNRVRFHGQYRPEEMVRHLGAVDCVVFPSVWYENAPLVIYEALYHGKQVISYPHGGAPEILSRYGMGIFADRSDPEALAGAMKSVLDDRSLVRKPLSRAVPGRAETLAAYQNLYFS
jgi:glycosyltransferase involved in cell wall biosynthesis